MLAYLAVEGPTSRDTLTTLFWPDADPDRARASLRRTLSALRSGARGHIDADRNRLALTGEIQFDIDQFRESISETEQHGHPGQDVCPDCIPILDRATSLYRGDFLEGFAINDAPMFEDWVRSTAEALRLKAGEAFNRLAHARGAVGDYPGAIASVNSWIEQDPIHEPAHRLLMLLHAWEGDRPGAIDAYQSFVGVLDRELGVSPLEETTELYEAILDEDLPPAPGIPRRVRAQRKRNVPDKEMLLDRTQELETLVKSSQIEGQGRLTVILGQSWMGKTRLLEEFARVAEGGDVVVLSARAYRMEQSLPYNLLTQIVEALLEMAGEPLAVPDWVQDEVSRFHPRISPNPPHATDQFGDLRIFEAFRELFAVLTSTQQIALIIDDAQWADRSSANLLAYVARRLKTLPMFIVLALRPGEEIGEQLQEILEIAHETVELKPLTPEEIKGQVEDVGRAEAIIAATGGIPLLIVETLVGKAEDTVETVARYVTARVGGLSDLARQLLATASVLPGLAAASLIREVSGRTEDEVVNGIEELINAGLLAETPDSENVRFALDAVERFVYDSTSLIRRRLLHERAAHALARNPRAHSDPRLAGAIAAQLHGAGDPDASSWYRVAGDLARDIFAHDEATSFYEAALGLGGDEDGSLRLALGEVAIALADYQKAKQELRIGAVHAEGATRALIEHRMGEVHRLLGRFDLAGVSFEHAAHEHPRPSELYSDHALLYFRTDQATEAVSMAERALQLARSDEGKSSLARALNIVALVSDDPTLAMTHINESLEVAGGDPIARMAGLNNKAHLLAGSGDYEGAKALVEEAIEIARHTGHPHRQAALHNHLADLHHQSGNSAEAELELTNAVSLFADIDAGAWEPELWLLRHW